MINLYEQISNIIIQSQRNEVIVITLDNNAKDQAQTNVKYECKD